MTQRRQPRGRPVGGQFAASAHDESAVVLTALSSPAAAADRTELDGGATQTRPGVWVVDGTSDYRPRTPDAVERLHELGRGYAEMNDPVSLSEMTYSIAANRAQMTCMVQTANGEMTILRGESRLERDRPVLALEDGREVDLADGEHRMLDVFAGDIEPGVFTRELMRFKNGT